MNNYKKKVFKCYFHTLRTVFNSLKTTPSGLIKPRAKSSINKVNRDFNLRAKKWGIKVSFFSPLFFQTLLKQPASNKKSKFSIV